MKKMEQIYQGLVIRKFPLATNFICEISVATAYIYSLTRKK